MRNENLEFLQDSLKYLGFGEKLYLNEQLKEYTSGELQSFQLNTEVFFDESNKLDVTLYFRRSEQLDMYFFNKYEARLRSGTAPDIYRVQTFYIHKGTGITVKEAFNLLQGRAVNRDMISAEGQKYNAWIQLNFAEKDMLNDYKIVQYRAHHGYDLERMLEKYPIRELNDPELRAAMIRSLRKGNQVLVTFDKASKTEKKGIEANPKLKTINIYPVKNKQAAKQRHPDEWV